MPQFMPGITTAPILDPTIAFLSNTLRNSSGSGFTFSTVGFGAADSTRKIIICVPYNYGSSTVTMTSCTIGGVAGTLIEDTGSSSGFSVGVAMWIAEVPTGTTGDVVTVFTANVDRHTCQVWRMINGVTTPYDSDKDSNNADTTVTTLNYPDTGSVIASGVGESGTGSSSWSGTDTVTERFDIQSGGDKISGARNDAVTEAIGNTISNFMSGTSDQAQVSASFWKGF